MAGRRNPRRAVHVRSHVALVGDVRRPGVDSHPYPDWAGLEGFLRISGGSHRARCRRERDEEGVALSIHLDAVVPEERLT